MTEAPALDDALTQSLTDVMRTITEAWAGHDAAAFAEAFTEDATLILPGDVYLEGREAIRDFMAGAFSGPYRGTRVHGQPVSVRLVNAATAVLVSRGGVLAPGERTVAPEREIRATWVLVREPAGWLLTAYQNTPVGALGSRGTGA